MDIKLNLNKRFVAAINEMTAKYGEEISRVNGLHNSNLNFTDFIDHFVDSQNVADVSIDANANSSTKDIRTLLGDMMKPHGKLLGYNKIFYEMTKKYGYETAKEWFEQEWNGGFYLHDSSSVSFLPYCVLPQECCAFILDGKKIYCSLEKIYEVSKEKEYFENGTYYKYVKNLKVLDYDKKNKKPRYTKVFCISHKKTEKDLYYTKVLNGMSVITTEDHKFISKDSDIEAKNLNKKDILYTTFDKDLFTNSIYEYNGLELTQDLGWLIGMYLAEGFNDKGQLNICQSKEKSFEEWNKILLILENIGIPYKTDEKRGRIKLKNGDNSWERKILTIAKGKYCDQKHLCEDFIHFNEDFLKGFLAGIIDGDGTIAQNKICMIRMTSRTLINQIRLIGLNFNVYLSDRLPYIQSQKAKIRQKRPMHSANVNMNRNKEFFLSLPSRKIQEKYTDFSYNEKFADKNYVCEINETTPRDVVKTYKSSEDVFDLSTESHTFVCNGILIHNCYAYDLTALVERGLFFVDKFKTEPAKHLTTYNDHVLEFISWTANRSSGAVGLPNYLVYSYYYWQKDVKDGFYMKSPEYYRRQVFQKFIYDLNQPYLRISECAFTNISIMDRNYLEELFGGLIFPDGEFAIDHIDEIIEHQKVFMEVVAEVREKCMMTFPVLTYSLLYQDGKFVDEPFARWCNKHNMKWYDSNFYVGSDVTSLSNCCRLISDTSKLNAFINSIGGTALSVGSIKVNTINLRRIAVESGGDKDKYLEILTNKVQLCIKTLDTVRSIITRNIEKGLLPNYTHGLIEMDKQYNTIGITAMYEVIADFGLIDEDRFGNKSYSAEGLSFATEILNVINKEKDSVNLGYSLNVECIPAERANVVLCEKDNLLYPELDKQYYIYSNQWIPLTEDCTVKEKIRLGSILDKECGGG